MGAVCGAVGGVAGSLLESACDQLPNPLPDRVKNVVLPILQRAAPVFLPIKRNLFAIMPFGITVGLWFTSWKIIGGAFLLAIFYGIMEPLTALARAEIVALHQENN